MPKNNVSISFDEPRLAFALYGPHNEYVNKLAEYLGIELLTKGSELSILNCQKDTQDKIIRVLSEAYELLKTGQELGADDLLSAYQQIEQIENQSQNLTQSETGIPLVDKLVNKQLFTNSSIDLGSNKNIRARNLSQEQYFNLLKNKEIVFAVGPAGTGKTYLAVAMAISCLMSKKVKKIILTRPAVEAGEKLGFLPGDMSEKVDPYLRPLYDALHEMLGYQNTVARIENGIIEIAPLAFMRGRTLNDAFIILDEAQNTTREQMKMFLTRLGFGSRAVITGDITQIDLLPNYYNGSMQNSSSRSGLVHSLEILKNVSGLGIHYFNKNDVVRHPLVGKIVAAYEEFESLNP